MKKILILTTLILSASLLAMPFANALSVVSGSSFSGESLIYAGQELTDLEPDLDDDITITGDTDGSTAGVFTSLAGGTFALGTNTITVSGTSKTGGLYENIGFLFLTNTGGDPGAATNTPFTGQILGGAHLDVSATLGSAYGAFFRNANEKGNEGHWANIETTGNIIFGNITVSSTDNTTVKKDVGAAGFIAGTLKSGNITINSIEADSLSWVFGIQLENVESGDIIISEGIEATAKGTLGDAFGIAIGRIDPDLPAPGLVGGKFSNGTIRVTGGITVSGKAGVRAIQVFEDVTGGTFEIDEITAVSENGLVRGFSVMGTVIGNTTINVGTVCSTSGTDSNTGTNAQGVFFLQTINSTGAISFGDIIAMSHHVGAEDPYVNSIGLKTGGAYGFTARMGIESEVILGDVKAIALDSEAVAIEIAGNAAATVGITGAFSVNSLTAKAAYDAIGIKTLAGGLGLNTAWFTVEGNDSGMAVDVESTYKGDAIGIYVDHASDLYLKIAGSVNAVAEEGRAVGIGGLKDVFIEITDEVTINAVGTTTDTGGIVAGGDISIALENGKNLSVTGDVQANGGLTTTGSGTAELGFVKIGSDGKVIIGKDADDTTRVTIDVNSLLGENSMNTLWKNATLVIDGEPSDGEETVLKNLGKWMGGDGTSTTRGNLAFSGGIFNGYKWGDDDYIVTFRNEYANMSDGFLAAFGMHNRYAAWNSVRDQMISGSGSRSPYASRRYASNYRGQSPCSCSGCNPEYGFDIDPCAPVSIDPCAPLGAYPAMNRTNGNNAWVSYIGRNDAFESSYYNRNWKLTTEGVQAGTDLFRSRIGQFGVLFGYESGKMTNVYDRIKSEDTHIGLYAAHVFRGGADIRAVYAYGWQDYKMNRYDNELYKSAFKGSTSEAHLELGKRLSPGPLSLRPVIAVDVLHNSLKGATETGSGDDAMRYGKTELTQVFLRAGTELLYNMHFLTLNSGVYYSYDLNDAKPSTYVEFADQRDFGRLAGPKFGRELLTFNVGGTCQVTDNFSVIGGYQGEYVFDRSDSKLQSSGYVGGAWRW